MTVDPNSTQPPQPNETADSPNGTIATALEMTSVPGNGEGFSLGDGAQLPQEASPSDGSADAMSPRLSNWPASVLTLGAIAVMILGLAIDNVWVGYVSAIIAISAALLIIWPSWGKIWTTLIPSVWRSLIVASFGILAGITGLLMLSGSNTDLGSRNIVINWDAIGALGELIGALGQIMIAILAVYVAWRQYVISRDLTIQQNRITQQQTIDAYFQGVSDLALGEQGLLEDWPQERVIAEGRTAAIIRSVDAEGKAKILRFLSQARLITPLKRDRHLGRPILDGNGSYAEDRATGIRVIDLGAMLAGADLANMDLRRTDLGEANLVRANLSGCDLVRANLSRSILFEANLSRANLRSAKFFYGSAETASPRTRTLIPDYATGYNTGAVVENVDFTGVLNLLEENRYYCCAWCGSKARETIPGGCEGIPNKLGR
ncbi:pentapeptide repeat-containing protein [Lyngbya sp. CCY1209]|uniref:pentapeptide repeat-containing protein n=1 Tax=Lyngbya sp. CCY1209 TaxID=2886103 RepID=UPI002D205223|nr:pentapeptide repeat-containing protein [Lyngbya sp. CCY1209]MEB3887072.1 pentapeptide repeat-containing protein [Lyngbya sp. CCY1209]